MMTLAHIGLVVLSLAWTTPSKAVTLAAGATEPTLRRFALVASSNDGGKSRVPLRFADSDARSMAEVLRQLGGLLDDDLVLLHDATRGTLQSSLTRLGAAMDAAGGPTRRELIVYYSGHSDEEGLLLAGGRVDYRELRDWIAATEADVRIAILDSCASGTIIRRRGVSRRPPFLSDISRDARGQVFLTASSADEAAQESERIGAGFFTHYLVSGMRGAADRSRDGRVTLGEAYDFAYDQTLQRTAQTASGAQHPAYDFQLAGTGDLVLTDVRASSASLVLDDRLAGRIYVHDASGRLVVELRKEPSHAVELGLAPGAYEVALENGDRIYRASVNLSEGHATRLATAQLAPAADQPAIAKRGGERDPAALEGEPGEPAAPESPSVGDTLIGESSLIGQTREIGGYIGVSMRYARLGSKDGVLALAEAALLFNRRFAIGITSGGGVAPINETSTLALGYAGLLLRYYLRPAASPFSFSIGAVAGPGGVNREFEEGAGEDVNQAVLVFEPQLGIDMEVTRFLRLGVDAGYRLIGYADEIPAKNMQGLAAGLHVQLGWF